VKLMQVALTVVCCGPPHDLARLSKADLGDGLQDSRHTYTHVHTLSVSQEPYNQRHVRLFLHRGYVSTCQASLASTAMLSMLSMAGAQHC
jgi:hypothetical protein